MANITEIQVASTKLLVSHGFEDIVRLWDTMAGCLVSIKHGCKYRDIRYLSHVLRISILFKERWCPLLMGGQDKCHEGHSCADVLS